MLVVKCNDKKFRKIGVYTICILCGIYTGDMIFRIIRYASFFGGDDHFESIILLFGNLFLDGYSYMILSSVLCGCIISSYFVWRLIKKRTLVAFIINFLSVITFIVTVSIDSIQIATYFTVAVVTVPLYIISGMWSIYFCIKDLCIYFLNVNKENN